MGNMGMNRESMEAFVAALSGFKSSGANHVFIMRHSDDRQSGSETSPGNDGIDRKIIS